MTFVWILIGVAVIGALAAGIALAGGENNFARLGDVTGKTPDEITAVVGPATSISAVGPGQVLYQWIKTNQAGGYHYALLFEDGLCVGFTHQHSS